MLFLHLRFCPIYQQRYNVLSIKHFFFNPLDRDRLALGGNVNSDNNFLNCQTFNAINSFNKPKAVYGKTAERQDSEFRDIFGTRCKKLRGKPATCIYLQGYALLFNHN